MNVKKTPLKDCYIIEPTVYEDERGYFYEKFNEKSFEDITAGDFLHERLVELGLIKK